MHFIIIHFFFLSKIKLSIFNLKQKENIDNNGLSLHKNNVDLKCFFLHLKDWNW
jgi:hypothetical protein